ncbi:MAG: universal stress protein [Actinomycetota bacterium]
MQVSTIVVGTDGSKTAESAVLAAGEVADAFRSEVHVVCANRSPNAAEALELREQLPEEFRFNYDPYGGAEVALDSAEHLLAEHQLEVHRHSASGDPASAILDLADDVDADLIVVGSRGHGRTLRFLRGSVSTKVMHHADRNVLVVHD